MRLHATDVAFSAAVIVAYLLFVPALLEHSPRIEGLRHLIEQSRDMMWGWL